MENKEKFFDRFCDTYKQKIESLIELESTDENEEDNDEKEERYTLTLLLAELVRCEEYCDDTEYMKQVFTDIQNKVDSIIFVLNEMQKRSNSIKEEIESLEKAKKSVDNKYKNLSKYLMDCLTGSQFYKFATDKYELAVRKSTALDMSEDVSESKLSDLNFARYIKSKTTFNWDKVKIKEDLKNNVLPENVKAIARQSSDYIMSIRNRTK